LHGGQSPRVVAFFPVSGGQVVLGVGQIGFEIDGLLEEADGFIVVLAGVVQSPQGDAQVGIGGIELDGLLIRSQGPLVRPLGKI